MLKDMCLFVRGINVCLVGTLTNQDVLANNSYVYNNKFILYLFHFHLYSYKIRRRFKHNVLIKRQHCTSYLYYNDYI